MRNIFSCLLAVSIPATVFGQLLSSPPDSLAPVHVKISASAVSEEVPLNRLAIYSIQLKWQGRLADIEFDPPESPQLSNFQLAGSSSSNWVGIENGQPTSIKTFEYSLRPEGLGMGYVEGMRVRYLDKATGEKHSLFTSRLGIKVVDPLPEPDEAPLGLALTIGLLLCAALVAVVFHLEARAKKKEAARLAALAVKPLEDEFLDELKSTVDINTTDLKEAFAALSKLLRRYLSRRYEIPAHGISTEEAIAAFRKVAPPEEQIIKVAEILQTCDLFKFSGEVGDPARLARTYALTENFLQMNRQSL
ncbi:MAG: BatD family protein [candidate division KSB1 bacterium]|nr:BatD family protein [candidate division KSB1 bacterium]MDZ7304843.1 BatD family protein [candidate division KSB1 bacterium]MDZ7313923.1 BatD family protein [candidate division KSB1 bacterium]